MKKKTLQCIWNVNCCFGKIEYDGWRLAGIPVNNELAHTARRLESAIPEAFYGFMVLLHTATRGKNNHGFCC